MLIFFTIAINGNHNYLTFELKYDSYIIQPMASHIEINYCRYHQRCEFLLKRPWHDAVLNL